MSSNDSMELKEEEPKTVRCENCRQDIEEKKMFLHEGFCFRNNVFCEHCKNVFLKKDYAQHIKDLPNNLTQEKQESDSKKSTSNEEEIPADTNFQEITTINPNPSLEVIHLPLEEQYTINTPIIISEGQIVSNKNRNEYILPFLGINPIENYYGFNETYYYNESYDDAEKQNALNILFNEEITPNNRFNNYYENNYQYSFPNNNNIYDQNLYWNNYKNSYDGNIGKNNDFYVNNNIITYDENETNYQSNNYLPEEIYSQNYIISNNNYSQDVNQNLYLENQFEKASQIGKANQNLSIYTPRKKEPADSISRFKSQSEKIKTRLLNEEKIKFNNNNNALEQQQICKYCNIAFKDISIHYKICQSRGIDNKNKNGIKRQINRDSILLNETLNDKNIEEFGIDDSKKKILNRKFIYSFQENAALDSEELTPKSFISKTEKKKIKIQQIKNGEGMPLLKNKLFIRSCPIKKIRNGLSEPKRKIKALSGKKITKIKKLKKRKKFKKSKITVEKENVQEPPHIFPQNKLILANYY